MRIAITSPAGKVDSEKLNRGILFLKSRGHEVELGATCTAQEFWTAGSAELRAGEFQNFWCDKNVDAVWAARGGFGCAHLLDKIDWSEIVKHRKLLCGHSDISVLHIAFLKFGVSRSLSAAMPAVEFSEVSPEKLTVDSTFSLLDGDVSFVKDELRRCEVISEGAAEGVLIPVTLSVLASLCGTAYLPDFKGAVLILEDVSESAYRLDAYLNQLRLNGILSSISALVFGDFKNCGSEAELKYIYNKYSGFVDGPVLCALPFGHCSPRLSVPVGEGIKFRACVDAIEL